MTAVKCTVGKLVVTSLIVNTIVWLKRNQSSMNWCALRDTGGLRFGEFRSHYSHRLTWFFIHVRHRLTPTKNHWRSSATYLEVKKETNGKTRRGLYRKRLKSISDNNNYFTRSFLKGPVRHSLCRLWFSSTVRRASENRGWKRSHTHWFRPTELSDTLPVSVHCHGLSKLPLNSS